MRYAVIGLTWLLFPALATAQDKLKLPMLVPNTEGHTARVNRVRFTPDGRQLVSVSQDKTIRIWDVNSGKAGQRQIGEALAAGQVARAGNAPKIGQMPPWHVTAPRHVATARHVTAPAAAALCPCCGMIDEHEKPGEQTHRYQGMDKEPAHGHRPFSTEGKPIVVGQRAE